MKPNQYLEAVLTDQSFAPNSPEFNELQARGEEVKKVLTDNFGSAPRLREAGSKKKGTMIRESYDLDLTCYFPHDDTTAGDSLKEIYENVEAALADAYITVRKGCAIRIRDKAGDTDLFVDVVPGRFVEADDGDVLLFPSSSHKERLKTNLDVHVAHVRESGVLDAIKLNKLWRGRNGVPIKTFPLELLVIDLLSDKTSEDITDQLLAVWTAFRDDADDLSIQDPANSSGNDLSELLDPVLSYLSSTAAATLQLVDDAGWEAVFGEVEADKAQRREALSGIAARSPVTTKPYAYG